MEDNNNTKKNHIVSISGRGASYCFMMNGDTQTVANECQVCVDCGFEVYIYLIEPSNLGQPGFTPKGALNLRRVYHLYEDGERYMDEAQSIVEGLSRHSMIASLKYIDIFITKLQRERENLVHDSKPFAPPEAPVEAKPTEEPNGTSTNV